MYKIIYQGFGKSFGRTTMVCGKKFAADIDTAIAYRHYFEQDLHFSVQIRDLNGIVLYTTP